MALLFNIDYIFKENIINILYYLRIVATLVQWYISEQNALSGYWKLVFAGVIDNQLFTLEDSIKEIGGRWQIDASF